MNDRLQKIIAAAGIASRRAAEKMIAEGRVSVNRVVIRKLGAKADVSKDEVRVDGKLILPNTSKIYLMLNKPRGYVTTLHDPEGRPIITDLTKNIADRVFPVGRLDYDSEGLLLITNDGDFAYKIQHPKFEMPKTYKIKTEGIINDRDMRLLLKSGILLDDGIFKPKNAQILKVGKKTCWLKVVISEGRNRLIRRGFETMGYRLIRLIRIAIADLEIGNLKIGSYRHLSSKEVQHLLSFSK